MLDFKMHNTNNEFKGNNLLRGHCTDAGSDIRANENCIIEGWGFKLVSTGLYLSFPKGYAGIIKSRSGLAVKHGIETGAGIIDSSYRGECRVLLRNFSNVPFKIAIGNRIAQLLIVPVSLDIFFEIKKEDLSNTERGNNGFGSTGV